METMAKIKNHEFRTCESWETDMLRAFEGSCIIAKPADSWIGATWIVSRSSYALLSEADRHNYWDFVKVRQDLPEALDQLVEHRIYPQISVKVVFLLHLTGDVVD